MIICRDPSVYSKKIDQKWILLEKNKEYTRELNEVAGLIWECAEKNIDTEEIARIICEKFDVDQSIAAKDINSFVKTYIKLGFLKAA